MQTTSNHDHFYCNQLLIASGCCIFFLLWVIISCKWYTGFVYMDLSDIHCSMELMKLQKSVRSSITCVNSSPYAHIIWILRTSFMEQTIFLKHNMNSRFAYGKYLNSLEKINSMNELKEITCNLDGNKYCISPIRVFVWL